MVTAAKAALELHIPHHPLLVGENNFQHSTSACSLLYLFEKESRSKYLGMKNRSASPNLVQNYILNLSFRSFSNVHASVLQALPEFLLIKVGTLIPYTRFITINSLCKSAMLSDFFCLIVHVCFYMQPQIFELSEYVFSINGHFQKIKVATQQKSNDLRKSRYQRNDNSKLQRLMNNIVLAAEPLYSASEVTGFQRDT